MRNPKYIQKNEHRAQLIGCIQKYQFPRNYMNKNNYDNKLYLFISSRYQNMKEEISEDLLIKSLKQKISHTQKCKDEQIFLRQHKKQKQNSKDVQTSQYFNKMKIVPCEDFDKLAEKLKKGGFRYKKSFNVQLEKNIELKAGNFYKLYVTVGYFQTTISMLRINMNSSLIPRKYFTSGSYASIFTQQFENEVFAIKSQKISEESIANLSKKFDEILQQYFIYKMASILEFGPKIKNLYNFDLVCFDDCVEFSMQLCEREEKCIKRREEYECNLLAGMKIMHTLQLVHRDIKSKNIAWSSNFQKWVFLDFGFSSFLTQKPGQKTLTFYRGTYEYSTKQLQDLYLLKTFGLVNLYQNDFYGIKAIKMEFFRKNPELNFIPTYNFSLMKYEVINENFQGMQKIFRGCYQLRNEFLKLVTIQIDRQNLTKRQSNSQLYTFYLKLKHIQVEKKDQRKNQMIGIIKERKKYFNLFIAEQENFQSMWIFGKQSDLKKYIVQKWDQFSFMKQLFIFFSETLYSDSTAAWRRMKLLTNIIIKLFLPQCPKKNWVWSFHYIFQKLEEKFLEKQYGYLKKIFYFYQNLPSYKLRFFFSYKHISLFLTFFFQIHQKFSFFLLSLIFLQIEPDCQQ